MTETEPSAPLPDRDAEIESSGYLFERMEWTVEREVADGSTSSQITTAVIALLDEVMGDHCGHVDTPCGCTNSPDLEQGDWAMLRRAERAEAENAVLRDRLAQVEALIEPGVTPDGEPLSEWVHVTDLTRALSAGTLTDGADETAGER